MTDDLQPVEPVQSLEGEVAAAEPAITDSHWQLRLLVERRERLDDEIADMLADRRDLMKEVTSQGYDRDAFNAVIKRRKMMPSERDAFDALLETYECALGMAGRGVIDGGMLSAAPRVERKALPSSKISTALALAAGANMARNA